MLKQGLHLKLSQKLSPQQIQLMNLIQLSTLDFEQKVKQEIEENIVLESSEQNSKEERLEILEQQEFKMDQLSEDEIPARITQTYSDTPSEYIIPELSISLHQHLLEQLNSFNLDEKYLSIAEFLAGSVDENGYMRYSLEEIVDDLAFKQNIFVSEKEVENVLCHVIHKMDPPGIGARNLQESILLQLSQMSPTKHTKLARKIISETFNLFSKKHYPKIIEYYNTTEESLREALFIIEKINPKPGGNYAENDKSIGYIVPDFTVRIENQQPVLELNSRNIPELHISAKYKDIMTHYQHAKQTSSKDKETISFIKQKIESAKWFIDSIHQRHQTLYKTMKAIIDYQKIFFLTGNSETIKPMILKDIAKEIEMDISTVSRVANSKYVATPYGTKRLKDFFSESIKTIDGEDISTIRVKSILKKIINHEDKQSPLRDDELVEKLKQKGVSIARRTIAKYREILHIPVARLRKEL